MFYESIILYVINKPCFMNPLYYEKIIEQVILPGLFLITTPLTWDAGGGAIFEVPGGKMKNLIRLNNTFNPNF